MQPAKKNYHRLPSNRRHYQGLPQTTEESPKRLIARDYPRLPIHHQKDEKISHTEPFLITVMKPWATDETRYETDGKNETRNLIWKPSETKLINDQYQYCEFHYEGTWWWKDRSPRSVWYEIREIILSRWRGWIIKRLCYDYESLKGLYRADRVWLGKRNGTQQAHLLG